MKTLTTLCTLATILIISSNVAFAANAKQNGQTSQQSATSVRLSGRSMTSQDKQIDFATVIVTSQSDSTQIMGTTSDAKGYFVLQVPRGMYRVDISFMGYDKFSQIIDITEDKNIGNVVLKENSVAIKSVQVKANVITREADRFVVNLGNSPLAIGKTASELLALSPGVWLTKDGISVGSKGGTKVMIDDRVLHYSGEELIRYLETLKAEDIRKIEIIPSAGADYDANASGGMIKITLKRQRDNGLDGSVKLNYRHNTENKGSYIAPSFSFNYKESKTSLYTNFEYYRNHIIGITEESTDFKTKPNYISSNSTGDVIFGGYNIRAGAIHEINSKHSIGAEITHRNNFPEMETRSDLILNQDDNVTDVTSLFLQDKTDNRLGVSANYIIKIDTLGSTLKLILDYNNSDSEDPTKFYSEYRGYQNFDTTYRSQINTRNDIYSVNLDFEKILTKSTKLKTGAKYIRNMMDNSSIYDYWKNETWNNIAKISNINSYSEDIGALYAILSTKTKSGIGIGLGLRGEYTYAVPETNSTNITEKQNYFSLFPNANLSIPLGKKKTESIVLNYNRKIRRPSFYNLNPFRMPLSEYSYVSGNPKLKPSFINDINTTFILKQKYSATIGLSLRKDDISQIGMSDPNNSDVIVYTFDNIQDSKTYYLNINIPANIRPWWNLNANLMGARQELTLNSTTRNQNIFKGNLNQTFTIAKKYYLGVEAFYMSNTIAGNMEHKSMFLTNINLKRNFAKNKFTASIYMSDIFNTQKFKITVNESDFIKKSNVQEDWRRVGFTISYNFRYGKTFKSRNIESGANEEKSRL